MFRRVFGTAYQLHHKIRFKWTFSRPRDMGGGGVRQLKAIPSGVQSPPIPGSVCWGKVKMPVFILEKWQMYAISGLRSIAPPMRPMATYLNGLLSTKHLYVLPREQPGPGEVGTAT